MTGGARLSAARGGGFGRYRAWRCAALASAGLRCGCWAARGGWAWLHARAGQRWAARELCGELGRKLSLGQNCFSNFPSPSLNPISIFC